MNKLTVVTIAFALFLYTVSSAVLSIAAAQNAGAAQEPIIGAVKSDILDGMLFQRV
jgi:hypothetical protein